MVEPIVNEVQVETSENSVMDIVQIEEYIHQQMADIAKVKDEMRLVKSMVDDTYLNDARYRELEANAKETAKVKNAYKKAMQNDPALAEQVNKLDSLKADMKDMKTALSEYLREFKRISGLTKFESRDGQQLTIFEYCKLVKE